MKNINGCVFMDDKKSEGLINIKKEPKNMSEPLIQIKNLERKEVVPEPAIRGKKIICILPRSTNLTSNENGPRSIDEESVKGRFGWAVIDTFDMPYIFRQDGNYCSLRMLEQKILNKMSSYFQKELLRCTYIRNVYVTTAEVTLLNAINTNHCNFQFGTKHFTLGELLINITDAIDLCQFFRCCYIKLESNSEFDISKRCGFIRINKHSVVPFSVRGEVKYVPMFYFEGDMGEFTEYATNMEGWELSYLKFCCKIQGIRNELFEGVSCQVVPLTNLKTFFPPDTLFEEFWPTRSTEVKHLKQRPNGAGECLSLSSFFKFDTIASTRNNSGSNNTSSKSHPSTIQKRLEIESNLLNTTNDPGYLKFIRNSHYVRPHSNFQLPVNYSSYILQQIIIENKMINCITMNPNDMADKWMALPELSSKCFDDASVELCKQVMDVLHVEVYKANTEQIKILKKAGTHCGDVLALVQVEKVLNFWPQIKYMLKNSFTKC